MKSALPGSMAALVFAAPALAADMSTPYFGPGPGQPGFGWAGVYLGAHGGYGWSSLLDAKGGFGGGQIGYNYQMNIFVFSVEGDGAWADISQTGTVAPFGVPVAASFKNETLASLRGRFGVTINNRTILCDWRTGLGTKRNFWHRARMAIRIFSRCRYREGVCA